MGTEASAGRVRAHVRPARGRHASRPNGRVQGSPAEARAVLTSRWCGRRAPGQDGLPPRRGAAATATSGTALDVHGRQDGRPGHGACLDSTRNAPGLHNMLQVSGRRGFPSGRDAVSPAWFRDQGPSTTLPRVGWLAFQESLENVLKLFMNIIECWQKRSFEDRATS